MSQPLADARARSEALHPERSLIVQAPAGSGKTGLLTQRFLCLLARVNQPEELVAITFTRKAAAEMKQRVVEALQAANRPPPDKADPFIQHTWQLGQQALQQDKTQGWQLLEHPGRLRILTMDALCAHLTRQLPLLSQLGGRMGIHDNPEELYQWAARATLATAREGGRWTAAVATLLDHLDNQLPKVEGLLAQMLARRDQWLRHVVNQQGVGEMQRPLLEEVLQKVIREGLSAVDQLLTPGEKEELWQLVGFAARNLREARLDSPVGALPEGAPFPGPSPEQHDLWLIIVEFLLTKGEGWRQRLTVQNGFPPTSQARTAADKARLAEMKERAQDLCRRLSEKPGLRESLSLLRLLPPPHYSEAQWRTVLALLQLLLLAAAQLRLRFQELGQVDFTEIALRAEAALGDPETPTPLAMKVDYQIRHLLVDEFQDTSRGQFRLLERLTAGWNGQDGRTLFLVGDPMQSIYRFREAEVGLFLRAQRHGIGQMALTPLTLTVNFRSQATLVEWVNATFRHVLPAEDEMHAGAVRHQAAVACRPPLPSVAVAVHPFLSDDPHGEAAQVVALAQEARQAGHTTAILVRARPHLQHILPALNRAGLRHQGIDLHSLAHSMVVQDLFSLTRALLCPADRIAWLAVLRAPWCGLSLADLTELAAPPANGEAPSPTLWEQIDAPDLPSRLSGEGRQALQRLKKVLHEAMAQRRRCNAFPGTGVLCFWVEHVWQALGGPATLPDRQGLADARRYFDLLAASERGGTLPDLPGFAKRVAALFAAVDETADGALRIMTIHKAKGLEFDTVILPGLGRAPRNEEAPLLAWMEHPAGLLLGPLKRVDQPHADPIHTFIRHMEKGKADHEAGRLLYVAATRARQRLHLLGHLPAAERAPRQGSFLHLLWPTLEEHFTAAPPAVAHTTAGGLTTDGLLRRLAPDWSPPSAPPPLRAQTGEGEVHEEPVLFEWAGETVRLVGIVVHRFLHTIALEGIAHWSPQRIEARQAAVAAHLERLGLPKEPLVMATGMVKQALLRTMADDRGRWILDDTRHRQAASELALTGLLHGTPHRVVLDRTFVDQEGVRWIIDFKTSLHQGGDLEGFLDNEQIRYREQMARYGTLMRHLSHEPIRLGLYFPMHNGWRAWAMLPDGAGACSADRHGTDLACNDIIQSGARKASEP
ncbi:MAG: UvrD-helicase domain-containing protein [Magnetococcus sp. MYC-9]